MIWFLFDKSYLWVYEFDVMHILILTTKYRYFCLQQCSVRNKQSTKN